MLIAVEGCVGIGKTTVAKGLAAVRKSKTLLEAFETIPFLEAFYKNPSENVLETEFGFLLHHYHELKVHEKDYLRDEVISDFHLGKDLLFAEANLVDSEAKTLFYRLYRLLMRPSFAPTLLVFLAAPDRLIVDRIRKRNRKIEQNIDSLYFSKINQAYEDFFEEYRGKKIKVSMAEWDFVEKPLLFHDLSRIIDQELVES